MARLIASEVQREKRYYHKKDKKSKTSSIFGAKGTKGLYKNPNRPGRLAKHRLFPRLTGRTDVSKKETLRKSLVKHAPVRNRNPLVTIIPHVYNNAPVVTFSTIRRTRRVANRALCTLSAVLSLVARRNRKATKTVRGFIARPLSRGTVLRRAQMKARRVRIAQRVHSKVCTARATRKHRQQRNSKIGVRKSNPNTRKQNRIARRMRKARRDVRICRSMMLGLLAWASAVTQTARRLVPSRLLRRVKALPKPVLRRGLAERPVLRVAKPKPVRRTVRRTVRRVPNLKLATLIATARPGSKYDKGCVKPRVKPRRQEDELPLATHYRRMMAEGTYNRRKDGHSALNHLYGGIRRQTEYLTFWNKDPEDYLEEDDIEVEEATATPAVVSAIEAAAEAVAVVDAPASSDYSDDQGNIRYSEEDLASVAWHHANDVMAGLFAWQDLSSDELEGFLGAVSVPRRSEYEAGDLQMALRLEVLTPVNDPSQVFGHVVEVKNPETDEVFTLGCAHCCAFTQRQLAVADKLEGCYTPSLYKNDPRLLLGYHPNSVTKWVVEKDSDKVFIVLDAGTPEVDGDYLDVDFYPALPIHDYWDITPNTRVMERLWRAACQGRTESQAVLAFYRTVSGLCDIGRLRVDVARAAYELVVRPALTSVQAEFTRWVPRPWGCEEYYGCLVVVDADPLNGFYPAADLKYRSITTNSVDDNEYWEANYGVDDNEFDDDTYQTFPCYEANGHCFIKTVVISSTIDGYHMAESIDRQQDGNPNVVEPHEEWVYTRKMYGDDAGWFYGVDCLFNRHYLADGSVYSELVVLKDAGNTYLKAEPLPLNVLEEAAKRMEAARSEYGAGDLQMCLQNISVADVNAVVRLLTTDEEYSEYTRLLEAGAVFSGNGLGQILEYLMTDRQEVLDQIKDFDLFAGVQRPEWLFVNDYRGVTYHVIPQSHQVGFAMPVYTGRVSLVEIGLTDLDLNHCLDENIMGNWVACRMSLDKLVIKDSFKDFVESRCLRINKANVYLRTAVKRFFDKLEQGYCCYPTILDVSLLGLDEADIARHGYVCPVGSSKVWCNFTELQSNLELLELSSYLAQNPTARNEDVLEALAAIIANASCLQSTEGWPRGVQVVYDLPQRGYLCPSTLPYERINGHWVVTSEVEGFAPPQPVTLVRIGRALLVNHTVGEFVKAVLLPYEYSVTNRTLTVTDTTHEYAVAVSIPYIRVNGMLLVTEDYEGFLTARTICKGEVNYSFVHSYFDETLTILGVDNPGDELVYGLELETKDIKACCRTAVNWPGKAIWKSDRSCGIELVFAPLSFEELCGVIQQMPLELLKVDSTCGMHVHINRRALTQRQQCMLALLLSDSAYEAEITKMAGRGYNNYCQKIKNKSHDEILNSTDRYEAVNLTNLTPEKYTVEVRIFAGTNSSRVVIERLRWLHSIVEFLNSDMASGQYHDYKVWCAVEDVTKRMEAARSEYGAGDLQMCLQVGGKLAADQQKAPNKEEEKGEIWAPKIRKAGSTVGAAQAGFTGDTPHSTVGAHSAQVIKEEKYMLVSIRDCIRGSHSHVASIANKLAGTDVAGYYVGFFTLKSNGEELVKTNINIPNPRHFDELSWEELGRPDVVVGDADRVKLNSISLPLLLESGSPLAINVGNVYLRKNVRNGGHFFTALAPRTPSYLNASVQLVFASVSTDSLGDEVVDSFLDYKNGNAPALTEEAILNRNAIREAVLNGNNLENCFERVQATAGLLAAANKPNRQLFMVIAEVRDMMAYRGKKVIGHTDAKNPSAFLATSVEQTRMLCNAIDIYHVDCLEDAMGGLILDMEAYVAIQELVHGKPVFTPAVINAPCKEMVSTKPAWKYANVAFPYWPWLDVNMSNKESPLVRALLAYRPKGSVTAAKFMAPATAVASTAVTKGVLAPTVPAEQLVKEEAPTAPAPTATETSLEEPTKELADKSIWDMTKEELASLAPEVAAYNAEVTSVKALEVGRPDWQKYARGSELMGWLKENAALTRKFEGKLVNLSPSTFAAMAAHCYICDAIDPTGALRNQPLKTLNRKWQKHHYADLVNIIRSFFVVNNNFETADKLIKWENDTMLIEEGTVAYYFDDYMGVVDSRRQRLFKGVAEAVFRKATEEEKKANNAAMKKIKHTPGAAALEDEGARRLVELNVANSTGAFMRFFYYGYLALLSGVQQNALESRNRGQNLRCFLEKLDQFFPMSSDDMSKMNESALYAEVCGFVVVGVEAKWVKRGNDWFLEENRPSLVVRSEKLEFFNFAGYTAKKLVSLFSSATKHASIKDSRLWLYIVAEAANKNYLGFAFNKDTLLRADLVHVELGVSAKLSRKFAAKAFRLAQENGFKGTFPQFQDYVGVYNGKLAKLSKRILLRSATSVPSMSRIRFHENAPKFRELIERIGTKPDSVAVRTVHPDMYEVPAGYKPSTQRNQVKGSLVKIAMGMTLIGVAGQSVHVGSYWDRPMGFVSKRASATVGAYEPANPLCQGMDAIGSVLAKGATTVTVEEEFGVKYTYIRLDRPIVVERGSIIAYVNSGMTIVDGDVEKPYRPALVHERDTKGYLEWVRYSEVCPISTGKAKELEVEWCITWTENFGKLRSAVQKNMINLAKKEFVFNEYNKGVDENLVDMVCLQDALKVDTRNCPATVIGNTVCRNPDNTDPEFEDMRNLIRRINLALESRYHCDYLCEDGLALDSELYTELYRRFYNYFTRPLTVVWKDLESGSYGDSLLRLYEEWVEQTKTTPTHIEMPCRLYKSVKGRNEMAQQNLVIISDLDIDNTDLSTDAGKEALANANVFRFEFQVWNGTRHVSRITQRGVSLVGKYDRNGVPTPIYDVVLFESSTVREAAGTSDQLGPAIRSNYRLHGYDTLRHIMYDQCNNGIISAYRTKLLNAMVDGGLLQVKDNVVVAPAGLTGVSLGSFDLDTGEFVRNEPSIAMLKAKLQAAGVVVTSLEDPELFGKVCYALRSFIIRMDTMQKVYNEDEIGTREVVGTKKLDVWLPLLHDLNSLKSASSQQTLSSVFFRGYLLPILLGGNPSGFDANRAYGLAISLASGKGARKNIMGEEMDGGKSVSIPSLPSGVMLIAEGGLQYELLNNRLRDLGIKKAGANYCPDYSQVVAKGQATFTMDNSLFVHETRAPMPDGPTLRYAVLRRNVKELEAFYYCASEVTYDRYMDGVVVGQDIDVPYGDTRQMSAVDNNLMTAGDNDGDGTYGVPLRFTVYYPDGTVNKKATENRYLELCKTVTTAEYAWSFRQNCIGGQMSVKGSYWGDYMAPKTTKSRYNIFTDFNSLCAVGKALQLKDGGDKVEVMVTKDAQGNDVEVDRIYEVTSYVRMNWAARSIFATMTGISYGVYQLAEALLEACKALINYNVKLPSMYAWAASADLAKTVAAVAEIYETILGAYSKAAWNMWLKYLYPVMNGNVAAVHRFNLANFAKAIDGMGCNADLAEEVKNCFVTAAFVKSLEVDSEHELIELASPTHAFLTALITLAFEVGRGKYVGYQRGHINYSKSMCATIHREMSAIVKDTFAGELHLEFEDGTTGPIPDKACYDSNILWITRKITRDYVIGDLFVRPEDNRYEFNKVEEGEETFPVFDAFITKLLSKVHVNEVKLEETTTPQEVVDVTETQIAQADVAALPAQNVEVYAEDELDEAEAAVIASMEGWEEPSDEELAAMSALYGEDDDCERPEGAPEPPTSPINAADFADAADPAPAVVATVALDEENEDEWLPQPPSEPITADLFNGLDEALAPTETLVPEKPAVPTVPQAVVPSIPSANLEDVVSFSDSLLAEALSVINQVKEQEAEKARIAARKQQFQTALAELSPEGQAEVMTILASKLGLGEKPSDQEDKGIGGAPVVTPKEPKPDDGGATVVPAVANTAIQSTETSVTVVSDNQPCLANGTLLSFSTKPAPEVVISGSRSLTTLPDEAKAKIDAFIARGVNFNVGDAYGIDLLVQQYLVSKGVKNVRVWYSTTKGLRNCIGGYQLEPVNGNYIVRDTKMHQACSESLVIWDGQSKGSKANIGRVAKTEVVNTAQKVVPTVTEVNSNPATLTIAKKEWKPSGEYTPCQQKFFEQVKSGKNIYLTGKAGTGKTFILTEVINYWHAQGDKVVVFGTTGISVMNLAGQLEQGVVYTNTTLNSGFSLGIDFGETERNNDQDDWEWAQDLVANGSRSRTVKNMLKTAPGQALRVVIEEVSMLDARVLWVVMMILEKCAMNYQVIKAGDGDQLPPVSPKAAKFFKTPLIEGCPLTLENYMDSVWVCLLRTNVRQRDDSALAQALNTLAAENRLTGPLLERLQGCISGKYVAPKNAVRIYYNNDRVREVNQRRTDEMRTQKRTYTGKVINNFKNLKWLKEFSPITEQMTLAIGMPVKIKKNHFVTEDAKKVLIAANGSRGIVKELHPNHVVVSLPSGDVVIKPLEFVGSRDELGQIKGFFTQLPLHPDFASTGHSCQGLTIKEPGVVGIFRDRIKKVNGEVIRVKGKIATEIAPIEDPEWAYVALSRFEKAEDIFFDIEDPLAVHAITNTVNGKKNNEYRAWLKAKLAQQGEPLDG